MLQSSLAKQVSSDHFRERGELAVDVLLLLWLVFVEVDDCRGSRSGGVVPDGRAVVKQEFVGGENVGVADSQVALDEYIKLTLVPVFVGNEQVDGVGEMLA